MRLDFVNKKSYLVLYDFITEELRGSEAIILLISNKGVVLSAVGPLDKCVRVSERKTALCQ